MGDWPPGKPEMQEEFALRFKTARAATGLTQEKLGHKVDMHRTYIGSMEQGDGNPSLWALVVMAWGLGIDPAELVKGLRPQVD